MSTTKTTSINNHTADPSEDDYSTLNPTHSLAQKSVYGTGRDGNGKNGIGASSNGPLVKVQPPQREDLQPSYAQTIQHDDTNPSNNGWYAKMKDTLGRVIGTAGAIPGLFCFPNPYKEVKQGQVGLVTKFGRFERAVDPGLVKINPLSESLVKVDVRIQIVGKYQSPYT